MWELDVEGHVLSQWAGRTVIRSCAKLAYHHAQAVIEADEAGRAQSEEPPVPLEAPHKWSEVQSTLLQAEGLLFSIGCPAEKGNPLPPLLLFSLLSLLTTPKTSYQALFHNKHNCSFSKVPFPGSSK